MALQIRCFAFNYLSEFEESSETSPVKTEASKPMLLDLLTLTKVMLDSGILTRRLIKERLDQSWGFL